MDKSPLLNSLNLTGYEELTDLALEYISGKVGKTSGLKLLNEIILPKKCFVTSEGLRVLIENLPRLELIENQGKMGVMLQIQHLKLQQDQNHFLLKEFSQMESVTSGGLDEDGVEDVIDAVAEGTYERLCDLNWICLEKNMYQFLSVLPHSKMQEVMETGVGP